MSEGVSADGRVIGRQLGQRGSVPGEITKIAAVL